MRLYGKNPVFERLRSHPKTIHKIYLQEGFQEASYIFRKAKQHGIPVFVTPKSKIIKIARHLNTQGVLAELEDFSYSLYEDLLEQARQKNKSILYVDSLNDPQNLGAIIRSLACFGKFSLVIPTHDCAEVTDSVLRVACGGENYISIAKVANLSRAIERAKEEGFFIAGAVVKGAVPLKEAQFTFPLGMVVGSEEKGIRDIVRRHLDLEVTIPMAWETLSLNVSHAAAVLCYEITRQKQKSKVF